MITIFIIIIIIAFIIIIIIIIINIPMKSAVVMAECLVAAISYLWEKDEHRETDDLRLKMNWWSILLEFF